MIKGLRYYNAYLKDKRLFKAAGVSESDVILASFPKSGNTWLRYILARAIYPEGQINQQNLQHYFPTVYKNSAQEIKKLSSPRFIKTHAAFFNLYPRCIYMLRDIRAVAVSGWFHAKVKVNYTGSLEEFITGPLNKTFGPWHWHVSEALDYQQIHPTKILIVRYEELLSNPNQSIQQILDFTGLNPLVSTEEIKNQTSFQKLQQLEKSGGQNPEQLFFRSGNNEDWKQHLSAELESILLDEPTRIAMQRCGYSMK